MRTFWFGVLSSLALGFGGSAMAYFMLTSPHATNCLIDGVPCSEVGALELLWLCAMPAALFVVIVLMGIRIRTRSLRAATWLVCLPPVLMLVYASVMASVGLLAAQA